MTVLARVASLASLCFLVGSVTSSESAQPAKHENYDGSHERTLGASHRVHLFPYAVKM